MPAGDLILEDYQVELRGILMGAGTDFEIAPPGIKGLGMPPTKTADVEAAHTDGSYGSPDYKGVRVITIPLTIGGGTAAAAMVGLATLTDAWEPASNGVDVPLYLRLPGWGKFHVNGRPRGLDEDLSNLKSGSIPVFATFVALDPAILPG